MRKLRFFLAAVAAAGIFAVSCQPKNPDNQGGSGGGGNKEDEPTPVVTETDLADITYQVNVYSFADSNSDGWGDIKGVTSHLDYFESLGVSALWLSPIQTSASYHGYDVLDYYSINPKLGTEADFKDLIDKAKAKGIDIYMDYVLNHSGRGEWFSNAISSETSPYRSYYVLSSNPTADVAAGKVDNYGGAKTPGMGAWHVAAGGNLGYKGKLHFRLDWAKKTITVTQSTDAVQTSNPSASKWLWIGSVGAVGLYETSTNIFEITIDVDTDWGFLIRTSTTTWDGGTKYGGNGSSITFGTPFPINNTTAANITFGGTSIQYFASFDQSMPDLNYGPYASASSSAAFKDLAASADKWINLGVNGLRLDAVLWIYQKQTAANVSFLKQWYDHCNATYKVRGGEGNLFMVGEAWADNVDQMAPYYQGLPSNFNFYYYWTLKDRINGGKGNDFASTVISFRNKFRAQRSDFIDAIKLSNHDEDRTGSDLGRNAGKEKLAGAVLLTSPGKPFIYQGEELGYYGTKSNGDEYIRTPIKWTKTGTVPSAALNGKVDNTMLNADISVEAQSGKDDSVLSVYRKFGKARNEYKSLAKGEMTAVTSTNTAVAIWTMSYDGETALVVHNFSPVQVSVTPGLYKLTDLAVSNGTVSVSGSSVTLGGYASAVFIQ